MDEWIDMILGKVGKLSKVDLRGRARANDRASLGAHGAFSAHKWPFCYSDR